MNIALTTKMDWTRLVIALALLCAVFSFSAMAQNNPNKPFDENEVKTFVAAFKERIEAAFINISAPADMNEQVFDKWDARQDLIGKTKTQIIDFLYLDYKLVRREYLKDGNADATNDPWEHIGMSDFTLEDAVKIANEAKEPTKPVDESAKPDYLDESKDDPGMLRFTLVNLPLDANAEELVYGEDSLNLGDVLGLIKRIVINKDKDGKQTSTGYMDVLLARNADIEAITKAAYELEINGKKIVGSRIKKP